jgi:dihydroorotate dehydrogenase
MGRNAVFCHITTYKEHIVSFIQSELPQRVIGIAAGLIKTLGHVPNGLGELIHHITFDSFTLPPRDGNKKEPTYYFDSNLLASYNAIGLKNMGLLTFIVEELIGRRDEFLKLKAQGCKIRVSLAPLKTGDLKEMVRILLEYWESIYDIIDEIEVNAACPNHRDEKDGRLHDVLAKDPVALGLLMREGMDCPCPKAIKIAPNTTFECLEEIVRRSIRYRYTTIVSGNTVLSDTPIDADGCPRISVPKCGMEGAPLLDSAVAQVSTLYRIIDNWITDPPGVTPTVIACGGVMSVDGARKHFSAGAEILQVATYFAEYSIRGIQDLVVGIAMTEDA